MIGALAHRLELVRLRFIAQYGTDVNSLLVGWSANGPVRDHLPPSRGDLGPGLGKAVTR